MAAIHRQVSAIAKEQGWVPPSYDRVRQILKNLDPALVTMAHQGAAVYREAFDTWDLSFNLVSLRQRANPTSLGGVS
jgi:hypothetical protein